MVGSQFLDVREWSVGPAGCPGVVERHALLSVSGRKSLPDVWSAREALPDVREWSGGPPGFPGVVGRPSRISVSGRKALTDVC